MSLLGGKGGSVIGRGDGISSGIRQSTDYVSVAMSRVDGRVQSFISLSDFSDSGSVATSDDMLIVLACTLSDPTTHYCRTHATVESGSYCNVEDGY